MSVCRSRKALVRAGCPTPTEGAVEGLCASPSRMPSCVSDGGDGREVEPDGERAQRERGHGLEREGPDRSRRPAGACGGDPLLLKVV